MDPDSSWWLRDTSWAGVVEVITINSPLVIITHMNIASWQNLLQRLVLVFDKVCGDVNIGTKPWSWGMSGPLTPRCFWCLESHKSTLYQSRSKSGLPGVSEQGLTTSLERAW